MSQKFRKRIRKIDKHLQFYLSENDNYYIGLLFEDYLKSPNLDKYGLPKDFFEDFNQIPNPIGSSTRANKNGFYVRKQPEEKETITRQIEYFRKRDGAHIKYKREYYVYKKIILHQFKIQLMFVVNEHGQQIVIGEKLNYSSVDFLKGTHVANIFCEIFNDFEIFDENLNPAIHFNTKFDEIILPSGKLGELNNFEDLVQIGKRFSNNEEHNAAYQKRLQILKEFNPDIRGKGSNGFFGYIVFGFKDLNIIILETMYAGNATYIFTVEDFEQKVIKDKQTVLNEKLHLARFFHHDNWEINLRRFMQKVKDKKSI
ncbi:MAG TPA: hypothetical protein VIK86_02310 [Candidatus Paceibacterota bacterium]